MDNFLIKVKIPKHRKKRDEEAPDCVLFEVNSFLVLIFYQLGQIASFYHLHYYVEIFILHKGFVELDDIRMLQFFVNLYLPEVIFKFLIFLLTFPAQLLYIQTL